MSEYELLTLWSKARLHVILAQLGPIVLLILTIWLLASGLGATDVSIRLAATGVLLAAGILGSLAEFSAAAEAQAIAADLSALPTASALARRAIASAAWAGVVKFVTPAIFVLVFIALLWALFVAPLA